MLDSLGVDLGLAIIDAYGEEESENNLVALLGSMGHFLAGGGQEDWLAGLFGDEPFFGEAGDDPGDCDMAHAHNFSEIADACLIAFFDELGD